MSASWGYAPHVVQSLASLPAGFQLAALQQVAAHSHMAGMLTTNSKLGMPEGIHPALLMGGHFFGAALPQLVKPAMDAPVQTSLMNSEDRSDVNSVSSSVEESKRSASDYNDSADSPSLDALANAAVCTEVPDVQLPAASKAAVPRQRSLRAKDEEGGKVAKRRRRQETHNVAEQRRRQRMNQLIDDLRVCMPCFAGSGCSTDKATVLSSAIEYIKDLETRVKQLERSQ